MKYKEIGSEFWDVPLGKTCNQIFPISTQWYISGRSALQAIIMEIEDFHTVALPSWCCDSIIQPFIDAGKEIHFYPVYWKDGLIQEIDLNRDVLFIMDYFGYTNQTIDLSGYRGTVVRDVTHSIFSFTYLDADYYFGSLRKWCGVWTGGYAWTRNEHKLPIGEKDDGPYAALRNMAMNMKRNYIEGNGDKGYLKFFEDAEDCLENIGVAPAEDRDIKLALKLDIEGTRRARRTNAEVLRKAFPDWLVFPEMRDSDCPMFVPVFVPDGKRDALRRYLIEHEIYCPVHWPASEYHKLDEKTEYLYKNELSLVCDQRYAVEDMNRMVEMIHEFIGE